MYIIMIRENGRKWYVRELSGNKYRMTGNQQNATAYKFDDSERFDVVVENYKYRNTRPSMVMLSHTEILIHEMLVI